MRIDRIELRNFKKFAQATFEFPRPVNGPADAGSFHVLIGENGTGKTSILDAVAVALGVWLEKVPDSLLANSHRRLTKNEKRLTATQQGDRMQFQQVSDTMSVLATGAILDRVGVSWGQSLPVGKTKVSNAVSKEVHGVDLVGLRAHRPRRTGPLAGDLLLRCRSGMAGSQ